MRSRTEAAKNTARRARMRRFKIVAPLLVLLILWLWLFYAEGAFTGGPDGRAFGADFAMFDAAAQIMRDGGNPYDHNVLYQVEHQMLASQGLQILKRVAIVRVGNPPLLFWAMQPLVGRPYQLTAAMWILMMYALSAIGFFALFRYFGWRRRALPLMICLLMPQAVLGPFYGNFVCIVFCGLALSLALVRSHPTVAGVLLTVAWMKPPIALPLVLLIMLFHSPNRRRVLAGFSIATASLFSVMLVTSGLARIPQWIHGLAGYSRDEATSPDVASFAGLYVRAIPHDVRLYAEVLVIFVALAVTLLAWHRHGRGREIPMAQVGWLWALWFLATPYAHFYDEVILAAPIIALLGQDGLHLDKKEPTIALYLVFFSLLVISAAPRGIQLLWLPILAVMVCLYLPTRSPRYRVSAVPVAGHG